MERPVYRVSQVNAYVKRMLTQDIMLSNLRMTGEISNYKRHSSGHLYFALKDAGAAISAVMFASDAAALRFLPKEGQKVIVQGAVSLYEKTGQYQFYVRRMEPDGIGALYQAFEALKQKLEAEGLFAPERKRPIPSYPRTVAIVTSPTGAAVQDMIQIARRRHPGILSYCCTCTGSGRAGGAFDRERTEEGRAKRSGYGDCRKRRRFDRGPVGF